MLLTPTAPMKARTAKGLRKLADSVKADHPTMNVHQHLQDAAAQLDRGNTHGANRHLTAAMHQLTPQQLTRHGVMHDAEHVAAKQNMNLISRRQLQIKDIADTQDANRSSLQAAQAAKAAKAAQVPPTAPSAPGAAPPALAAAAKPPAARRAPGAAPSAPGLPAAPPVAAGKQKADARVRFGADVELSAQTARLAMSPAPLGKPGGPGLYHVRGMGFPPYFQNVRNALIRGGKTESEATQMTWGIIRRWSRGGGGVHPEVQAAAVKALADLKVKSARAHAQSSEHANDRAGWTAVELSIGLATAPQGGSAAAGSGWNEAAHPRVPAGQAGGGQFGAKGGTAPAVRHLSPQQRDHLKGQLERQIAQDRQKIAALRHMISALESQLHAARARSSAAKAGSKAAPTAASQAAAAKAATAAKKAPAARGAAAKAPVTAATLHGRIIALRAQLGNMVTAMRTAVSQVAKL
jgi:hypothetical protein